MRSTQVYLTEEEHAALQRAAERDGSSMTAVVRGLIEQHLIAAEASPTDLTELVGIFATSEPTDVANEKDSLLYEDLVANLRRHERSLRVAES